MSGQAQTDGAVSSSRSVNRLDRAPEVEAA
jgi:hypothetical protein